MPSTTPRQRRSTPAHKTFRSKPALAIHTVAAAAILVAVSCPATADRAFALHNPLDWTRSAADVVIDRDAIGPSDGRTVTAVEVTREGLTFDYPFQLDDLDDDGRWDELYFQVAMQGGETLSATVRTGRASEQDDPASRFPARADAIADAAESPDVTKPAWESDTMTYCVYGAAQVDAIGKIVPQLSIDYFYREPTHSQHGFTVEHGKDFLAVGNTMGAHAPFAREPDGTIARPWTTDGYSVRGPLERDARHVSRVIAAGPLRAIVETRIDRWTTDLGDYACTIRYTIAAGQRHTRVRVVYDAMPDADADADPDAGSPTLGAGTRAFREDLHVLRGHNRVVVASRNVLEGGMLVPWLGRAIVAGDDVDTKPIDIPDGAAPEGIRGSGPNYGLLFPNAGREVEYAFLASWSFDDGITSWPQFQSAVDRLQRELSEPVTVTAKDAARSSSE